MTELVRNTMYKFAKIYSNKGNFDKTGISILDEKIIMPRDIINAGSWLGFIVGFTFCYKMLVDQEKFEDIDDNSTESR